MCVHLCNQLHAEGRRIELVIFHGGGTLERLLHPEIQRTCFQTSLKRSAMRLLGRLRQLPETVPLLAFGAEIAAALLFFRQWRLLANPVVYREGTAVGSHATRFWRLIYRSLIRRADVLIAQTEATAAELRHMTGSRRNIEVLPNPCPVVAELGPTAARLPGRDKRGLILLAAGRLATVKGHGRLLAGFQGVVRRWPESRLWIAGEGPERAALERQIVQRELENHVELRGFVPDLAPLYQAADAVVIASHYEGLSNVLIEGLAHGRPVLAAAGAGGTVEFMERLGLGAFLIPDAEFAQALPAAVDALWHADLRQLESARERLVSLVHPQTVARQCWRILQSAGRQPRGSVLHGSAV